MDEDFSLGDFSSLLEPRHRVATRSMARTTAAAPLPHPAPETPAPRRGKFEKSFQLAATAAAMASARLSSAADLVSPAPLPRTQGPDLASDVVLLIFPLLLFCPTPSHSCILRGLSSLETLPSLRWSCPSHLDAVRSSL